MTHEPTLVVAIGDFLEDGSPSIFVGHDLGANYQDRLLRRTSTGTFEDVAVPAGFATDSRGYGVDSMGFTSGDPDRDGELEHAESSFEARATSIFDCYSPGVCEDRGIALGMRPTEDTFRWGNAFLDVDLDGWIDLIEATGHYQLQSEIEVIGFVGAELQAPNVLMNRGDGTLAAIRPSDGDAAGVAHAARGIARTDFDDDGRVDVVLATVHGPPVLLRNVHPYSGRWLRVVLRGRPPNTHAVGARVTVELARGPVVAEQRAGEGFLGSFDPRLFFGLGRGVTTVNVRVRWPSGTETRMNAVSSNRELIVREP